MKVSTLSVVRALAPKPSIYTVGLVVRLLGYFVLALATIALGIATGRFFNSIMMTAWISLGSIVIAVILGYFSYETLNEVFIVAFAAVCLHYFVTMLTFLKVCHLAGGCIIFGL